MITNTGKNILSKFLINQAPSYASYIAFGCGAKALSPSESFSDYSEKKYLDFEMFRSPIISRGFITTKQLDANGNVVLDENNNPVTTSEIVFTAELPSQEQYEITEMGLWSAGSNPFAGVNDSRILFNFSETETWQFYNASTSSIQSIISIPSEEDSDFYSDNNIITTYKSFRMNADHPIFQNSQRIDRQEKNRFLNSMLLIDTSTSNIVGNTEETIQLGTGTNSYLLLQGASVNLDSNSPNDVIKVAFSVVNKLSQSPNPDNVRIIIQFVSGKNNGQITDYATFSIFANNFSQGRYIVETKSLNEIVKTGNFAWSEVTEIRIYASAQVDEQISDGYLVGIDAIRLENVTAINPIYGMTAYTVIKTDDGNPMIKEANSTNLAEFRFSLDVMGI